MIRHYNSTSDVNYRYTRHYCMVGTLAKRPIVEAQVQRRLERVESWRHKPIDGIKDSISASRQLPATEQLP